MFRAKPEEGDPRPESLLCETFRRDRSAHRRDGKHMPTGFHKHMFIIPNDMETLPSQQLNDRLHARNLGDIQKGPFCLFNMSIGRMES